MSKICPSCLHLGRLKSKRMCPRCSRCLEHVGCRCHVCAICRMRVPPKSTCKQCRACLEHHANRYGEKFPHRDCTYNIKPDATTFTKNTLRRLLGIELEVSTTGGAEDSSTFTPYGHWAHDGSVKPSELEFDVRPYAGDQFINVADIVSRSLRSYGATVNGTCGFHVHVDSADLDAFALRRLFVGFGSIQRQLLGTLVHANRARPCPDGNYAGVNFCNLLPIVHDLMGLKCRKDIMHWFHAYLYALGWPDNAKEACKAKAALDRYRANKYQNAARRQALNFHSWMMRGTLEFRLKEGTLDSDDIIHWPLWCGWFVEKVSKLPDSTIGHWMSSPPSILDLTKSWKTVGRDGPSKATIDWVVKKIANPTTLTPTKHANHAIPNAPVGAAPDAIANYLNVGFGGLDGFNRQMQPPMQPMAHDAEAANNMVPPLVWLDINDDREDEDEDDGD